MIGDITTPLWWPAMGYACPRWEGWGLELDDGKTSAVLATACFSSF
jgi:hypothetical protein